MISSSRQNILYSKGGGHYYPAFFKLGILNGVDFTKINDWDESSLALFFHEYVHFLQDISTIHGLNNIIRIGEVIQESIAKIRISEKGFETPIPFSPENINTKDISYVLCGYRGEINRIQTIEDIEVIEKFPVNDEGTYHVPKVTITYNGDKKVEFGAHAIMEGMAFIGEQYVAKNDIPASDYPYKAVSYVVDFLCPSLSDQILNIYALCDLSLMHSEPGPAFIKYLKTIHLKSKTFINPKEIYKFFDDELFIIYDHLDGFKKKKMKRIPLYLNLASRALFYISGYFQHIPDHPNIAYLKRQLEVISGYRLASPEFMIKIIEERKFYGNKVLGKLIDLLGSPILVDLNGNTSFLPPANFTRGVEMEIPWMMTQFLSDISSSHNICKAIRVCQRVEDKLQLTGYTNENCYENPWARAQQEPICSYGRLLTIWNIRDKTKN